MALIPSQGDRQPLLPRNDCAGSPRLCNLQAIYLSEPRHSDQHNNESDHEYCACQRQGTVYARFGDRTRAEGAGNTGPPIGEQSNIHHDMANHRGNERPAGPRKKPQQEARAEHDWNHANDGPSLGEMQDAKNSEEMTMAIRGPCRSSIGRCM